MVYKGCQKRMIMLKNTGSEIFEEAYFILRERGEANNVTETDMVREAARIIDENLICAYYKKGAPAILRDRLRELAWYLAGALTCGSIIGIASMIG